MSSSLFLRRILALDALSCVLMGLLMGFGAAALAPLLGLAEPLVRIAGLLLLPLAAFIAWLASRPAPSRTLVWVVIVGNVGWTVESFLLIGSFPAESIERSCKPLLSWSITSIPFGSTRPRNALSI